VIEIKREASIVLNVRLDVFFLSTIPTYARRDPPMTVDEKTYQACVGDSVLLLSPSHHRPE